MSKRQPDPYVGPTTLGIDVSKWQDTIDWKLVSTDLRIKFAISRTGDGRDLDDQFDRNWKESGRIGLIRGSYHFFRADRDGKFQADLVISALKAAGGLLPTDLPPAIDIEGGVSRNLPGGVFAGVATELPIGQVAEECLEFLSTLENELGVVPLIYTGQAFHWWLSQAHPELAKDFERYPLWVPSYSATPIIPANVKGELFPWPHWSIWQYTSSGTVAGIKGSVDMNKFRGTEADLKLFVSSLRHASALPPNPREEAITEMRQLILRLAELQAKLG